MHKPPIHLYGLMALYCWKYCLNKRLRIKDQLHKNYGCIKKLILLHDVNSHSKVPKSTLDNGCKAR